MAFQIQVRRGTTAEWAAADPVVPAAGEPCFDTDTGILKIGDGATTYALLDGITGGGAVTSVNTQTGDVVLTADHIDDAETTNKFATQGELDSIATALQPADGVGYQIWNGSTWSARPTGYGHVEAFSDGTRGSTRDAAAPAPTGAQNGDRWWDVDA